MKRERYIVKAAILEEFSKMIVQDIPKPVLGNDEVLIRMKYAGVCGSDITVYTGKHPTATTPVVVGHEIIGTIEAVNTDKPTNLKIGDRVTVEPLISCGMCEACLSGHVHVCQSLKLLGIHENGGYAEYTKASINKVVKIEKEIDDRIAALAEPFAVGFHVISRSQLKHGNSVFIIGAGPIGMVIAIAAKAAGASRIVLSEVNDERVDVARAMGFEAFNPTKTDAMENINSITNGNGFDVVFEVSGSQQGILLTTKACKIRGTIVPLSLSGLPVEFELGKVSFKELSVIGTRVYCFEDFVSGVRLLEASAEQYDLSKLISDEFSIDNAQKAIDMMMAGKNTGKILINCGR